MWSEAVRSLREAQPKAFIFENVNGLKRQTFATYLDYILLQLQHPYPLARIPKGSAHAIPDSQVLPACSSRARGCPQAYFARTERGI
jgi:hypothetical protein